MLFKDKINQHYITASDNPTIIDAKLSHESKSRKNEIIVRFNPTKVVTYETSEAMVQGWREMPNSKLYQWKTISKQLQGKDIRRVYMGDLFVKQPDGTWELVDI